MTNMEQIIKKKEALKTFAKWSELDKQPRNDIAYMSIAFITASLSKAVRSKVGAIIVKNGIICSSGYNGTPRGTDNACEYVDENNVSHTHEFVIHAELNALLNMLISGAGTQVKDATAYITYSPCIRCASMLKQAGISRVVFSIPYRDDSGIKYLMDNDVQVEQIYPEVMDKFMIEFAANNISHR